MRYTPPISGGGSGAAWVEKFHGSYSTEPAADWTSGTHTAGGLAANVVNGASATTFGPDGSTGIRLVPGASNWIGATKTGPAFSHLIADMVTGYAPEDSVFVVFDLAILGSPSANYHQIAGWWASDDPTGTTYGARCAWVWNTAYSTTSSLGFFVFSLPGDGGGAGDRVEQGQATLRRIGFLIEGRSVKILFSALAGATAPDPTAAEWSVVGTGFYPIERSALFTDAVNVTAANLRLGVEAHLNGGAATLNVTITDCWAMRYE